MIAPNLIPARDAAICWFCQDGQRGKFAVTEVHVFHQKDTRAGGAVSILWSRPEAYTHGCVFADWLSGKPDMTPEWVFSEILVFHGFADSQAAERAIAEFGKIDTCAWARAMVPSKQIGKPEIHWRWASAV